MLIIVSLFLCAFLKQPESRLQPKDPENCLIDARQWNETPINKLNSAIPETLIVSHNHQIDAGVDCHLDGVFRGLGDKVTRVNVLHIAQSLPTTPA
jgi:hypothetical protein